MKYRVVVNADGQHSVWPANDTAPAGWFDEGTQGSREECLDRIEQVWTDQRPARAWIRSWLADRVAEYSDGALTPAAAREAQRSFAELGVSSLAIVRLVDAVEAEFGVTVGFGSGNALADLRSLTEFIALQRVKGTGPLASG